MSDTPKSKGGYKTNPGFVRPEPSGADCFSFCAPDEYTFEKHQEICRGLEQAGANYMRVTVVSDEYPHEPYPHGYWYEGWRDPHAVPIPFGSGRPDDGTISPPLTAEKPHD